MVTVAIRAVLAVLGLIVSVKTRVDGIPVLWLLFAAVVLALAAVVLWLARSAIREGGLWLRRRTVTA